jgi:hypothetical protein
MPVLNKTSAGAYLASVSFHPNYNIGRGENDVFVCRAFAVMDVRWTDGTVSPNYDTVELDLPLSRSPDVIKKSTYWNQDEIASSIAQFVYEIDDYIKDNYGKGKPPPRTATTTIT